MPGNVTEVSNCRTVERPREGCLELRADLHLRMGPSAFCLSTRLFQNGGLATSAMHFEASLTRYSRSEPREVRARLGMGTSRRCSCVTASYLARRFLGQPLETLLRFGARCGGDVDTVGAGAMKSSSPAKRFFAFSWVPFNAAGGTGCTGR